MDGYGWLKMGEMDGMVEIVPQLALSFGATYTIFLHSKQLKPYQGTLRTQEPTPIGSETSLGPSMDPTGPLK